MSTGTLARLLEQADAGPWWFDGRDIFHKQPGTNLDQIIIPIPSAEETFHPSQAVTPATARLASLAPDLARLLADMAAWVDYAFERLDMRYATDESVIEGQALLARFAELGARAAQEGE